MSATTTPQTNKEICKLHCAADMLSCQNSGKTYTGALFECENICTENPLYKYSCASGGKSARKVKTPKGERSVRKGPRGGEYVIYDGKKVPASRFDKKKKK